METPRKVLLTTLKDLRENEFKEFKSHLEEKVLGFPRIPKSELEKAADRLDTRDLMFLYYGIHTIKVTTAVLKEIPRNDLVEELSKFHQTLKEETTSCPGGDHFLSWGRPLPVLGETTSCPGGDHFLSWGRPLPVLGDTTSCPGGDHFLSWGIPLPVPLPVLGETTSCPGGDHFLSRRRPLPVLGLHVGVLNGGFSLVTVCLTDCNKVFLKQRVKDCDRHQVQ
ncbi:hypothetical protein KUCAC02_037269 [Chaenocephalus aceratus]|nr:hypothetical protein KUCAC02_037269 [Chaenocephalus aceratus]